MPKITELIQNAQGRVYIYCSDPAICERFLSDAEAEGFTFRDGALPTSRKRDCIYVVNFDRTINYVGAIGHIAYGAGAKRIGDQPLIQIDYRKMGE